MTLYSNPFGHPVHGKVYYPLVSLTYGVCPFVDALDDFLLPKPKMLKPPPPPGAAVVLPEDAATTSGLDPFLAAKSWKLIGGAEALRGLLE